MDSFEIFDYIMLGQLKAIYIDFWSDLSHLFEEKNVHGHSLPKLGKNKMKTMLDEIRKARNDNAHHKPFHKTRRRRHQIIEDVARETNQNGNHVITYSAIVQVKLYDSQRNFITKEDTGVGTGTARTVSDAIDNASKSAVSDSLKRSLRSLGAQFGNNLYSKTPNISQPQQQYQQPQSQQLQNTTPPDYSSLYNIGLTIMEQGQNLVVLGDDIFSKKDSIKACGSCWSGENKMWYKPLEQQQVA